MPLQPASLLKPMLQECVVAISLRPALGMVRLIVSIGLIIFSSLFGLGLNLCMDLIQLAL